MSSSRFHHSVIYREDIARVKRVLSVPAISEQNIKEGIPQVEAFLSMYFEKRKTVYPSDVANKLGMDYEVVREIFDRLSKEEKVKVARKMAS